MFVRLTDILVEDHFKHLGIDSETFSAKFPQTITLDQTIAVWKHIVHYQEEQKHS